MDSGKLLICDCYPPVSFTDSFGPFLEPFSSPFINLFRFSSLPHKKLSGKSSGHMGSNKPITMRQFVSTQSDNEFKVNRQQPRSARLRLIQKIPTPIKLLISPLPEMINQICKKYSLENSQDKKTSDDTCDIFQK